MNSIPKISYLPIQKLISSTCTRSIGVQMASSPKTEEFLNGDFEDFVQVNSPELKNAYGFDKCFVETRGNEILAVAGTKKLLMEEKLRQSLLCLNVPFNKVVQNTQAMPCIEPLWKTPDLMEDL